MRSRLSKLSLQLRQRAKTPRAALMTFMALVIGSLLISLPGFRRTPQQSNRVLDTRKPTQLEPPVAPTPTPFALPSAATPAVPAQTTPAYSAHSTAAQEVPAAPTTLFSWPNVSTTTTTTQPQKPLAPVPVPASGLYLGAYVDPYDHAGYLYPYQEVEGLPLFHQLVPRKLAIVSVYQSWEGWARNDTLTQIADREGAIPMVSWRCGDTNANVNAGKDDALIFAFANQLKSYGRPVFLRWYWEMNLMRNDRCLDTGDPNATDWQKAAGYAAAFRRIYRIFKMVGATNVALVWCPSSARIASPMQWFYPGDDHVDWIAADGYDRHHLGRSAFTEQFKDWYSRYKGKGKPMMVAETGAPADDQRAFLQGVASDVPALFPKIKALIYFNGEGGLNWRLDKASGGVDAFNQLAATQHFATMPARN